MTRQAKLSWVLYVNLAILAALAGYKFYLVFLDQHPAAVHASQVERIEAILEQKATFSFAVVGNINNSIGIFERRIIPMLNRSGVDFVISAGNAVSNGGEDKYRALSGTLARLKMPYLLTFGEHEFERFGGYHFYNLFGPYLFSFSAGDSRFVFLDSTGKTSYTWQLRWLEELLTTAPEQNTFVFSGHALRPVASVGLFDDDDYLWPEPPGRALAEMLEQHAVDAVFSASLPRFTLGEHEQTAHVITGGAGGLVLNTERSFHHYVRVTVADGRVEIVPVRLDIGQHRLFRSLESLWLFIHSLVYVGYLNFIWLLCGLTAVSVWLYSLIFTERNYYPDFDVDPQLFLGRSLKVAMFTNNYLPFIGGVPISIQRLRQGLTALQHQVLVVAPSYRATCKQDDESDTLRLRSLLHLGSKNEFPIANPLSVRLLKRMLAFRPDLVHLHHPVWLGSLGLLFGKRMKLPLVYTYHTRLEHYAHYVPLPGALFRNLISHALIRRFANRCDAVVVPTDSAEKYLRLIGVKSTLFVLPTGIECQRFARVDELALSRLRKRLGVGDEIILISVSRLSREKNIDFMLESLQGLAERSSCRFRLLIIGEGEERPRLEEKIRQLGLAQRVTLIGAVAPADMPLYYQLAQIFVFASRSETQGMVVLEAMAAGLPVVVVRSSGVDELVTDGINGFKTLLNQAIWRERVEQLLVDETLRKQMGDQAREFAEGHSVEAFSQKMVEIYAYVLSARVKQRKASAPSCAGQ